MTSLFESVEECRRDCDELFERTLKEFRKMCRENEKIDEKYNKKIDKKIDEKYNNKIRKINRVIEEIGEIKFRKSCRDIGKNHRTIENKLTLFENQFTPLTKSLKKTIKKIIKKIIKKMMDIIIRP